MVVRLQQVVPFGRSLDEYVKMFNLSPSDLQKRILGIADGPASFNAEATQCGYAVTSVDPIYEFSAAEILSRFNAVVDDIIDQVKSTPDDWIWSYHQSPDDLRESRVRSLHLFLDDYDQGKHDRRYQVGALPSLNFFTDQFELVLCSHFLFLYSEQLDYCFHRDAILELLRISPEVRIFPLMTLMLERSPHLDPLIDELTQHGYTVSVEKAQYELQKGGNEVMIVQRT